MVDMGPVAHLDPVGLLDQEIEQLERFFRVPRSGRLVPRDAAAQDGAARGSRASGRPRTRTTSPESTTPSTR